VRPADDLDRADVGVLEQKQDGLVVAHVALEPVLEEVGDGGLADALPGSNVPFACKVAAILPTVVSLIVKTSECDSTNAFTSPSLR
jgi:hypothetical protein